MLLLLLLLDIIKAHEAISFADGKKLFRIIKDGINSKRKITVDFSEVTFVTVPFLNAAFGQLFKYFKEDEINNHLIIINLKDDTKQLLEEVIERSKEYYNDPESFTEIVNDIIYGI
ncbi:MAG: DUF4325 domain-containing protein [Bacteroidales bacterium]|nr:DUF4325 domain-containing protein [Bacteroidales bacterium]